jgi:hypothetical protein
VPSRMVIGQIVLVLISLSVINQVLRTVWGRTAVSKSRWKRWLEFEALLLVIAASLTWYIGREWSTFIIMAVAILTWQEDRRICNCKDRTTYPPERRKQE